MKILRVLLIALTVVIWANPFARAQMREELTLSTYYPAPFGEYDELTANRITTGDITTPGGDLFVDGSIGVNVNPPQARVHVLESSNIRPAALIRNADGDGLALRVQGTDGAGGNVNPIMQVEDNSGDAKFIVQADGNVGIGTDNPESELHIEGPPTETNVRLRVVNNVPLANGNGDATIELHWLNEPPATSNRGILARLTNGHADGADSFWSNWVNGTEVGKITLDETGNVGIGTTAPQAILDVSSTTSGILLPRVANPETDIASPQEGMLVYNDTADRVEYRDPAAWKTALAASSTMKVASGAAANGTYINLVSAHGFDSSKPWHVVIGGVIGSPPGGNWLYGLNSNYTKSSDNKGFTITALMKTQIVNWRPGSATWLAIQAD
ncbi:hypothetical protein ACFL0T_05260 [Candidatus Omnitrophota bacterium]